MYKASMESPGHWRDWAGNRDGPLISTKEQEKKYLVGRK